MSCKVHQAIKAIECFIEHYESRLDMTIQALHDTHVDPQNADAYKNFKTLLTSLFVFLITKINLRASSY